MKTMIFLLLLYIITLTGCVPIIKWKYGIRNPKEETPATLLKFLKTMNKSPENIYIFRDSTSYFHAMNHPLFRKNLIGLMFFNKKGILLDAKDTTKCQWSVASFIKDLGFDSLSRIDTTFRFDDLESCLIPLTASPENSNPSIQFNDYIIVVTWGKFAGKLNSRLFDADEELKKSNQISVRLIFVNIDMQKDWHLNKSQKLLIR